ncbi:class I SAM-dependent methyltransferase [Candidatus Desantisbacteria bacterium]|nr:class I SAM-dependent methyltransferase [Candidatus Desantisbacteria bacterium]
MQNINNSLQNKIYHSFCPVCHNNNFKNKFIINDFTITQCLSCGLMFVKEKLSQQELDDYYKKGIGNCVYLNDENVENLKYYYRNLRAVITDKIPTGKILDIGCNTGYFLDVMEGFERYGIERSLNHGNIAKGKYGDKVFVGTFEDYKIPDFLFDCITMQDVLDHLIDPVEALKKCNKLLKPGGILIIKVHDLSSLYAKIMGKNFYAFIMTLDEAAFNVVFSKHMGHLMFFSTVFYRLSRGEQNNIFFRIYKLLEGTKLGNLKLYKNLHDIITVFAVKKKED